jgi:hypothetical protein
MLLYFIERTCVDHLVMVYIPVGSSMPECKYNDRDSDIPHTRSMVDYYRSCVTVGFVDDIVSSYLRAPFMNSFPTLMCTHIR